MIHRAYPTILLTGVSGKQYPFNKCPANFVFPECPGVYAFLSESQRRLLYIGEAQNFAERLNSDHQCWFLVHRGEATHIGLLPTRGERRGRLMIEKDLRDRYATPHNEQ